MTGLNAPNGEAAKPKGEEDISTIPTGLRPRFLVGVSGEEPGPLFELISGLSTASRGRHEPPPGPTVECSDGGTGDKATGPGDMEGDGEAISVCRKPETAVAVAGELKFAKFCTCSW